MDFEIEGGTTLIRIRFAGTISIGEAMERAWNLHCDRQCNVVFEFNGCDIHIQARP